MVTPNIDQSVNFLQKWSPSGNWALSVVNPVTKSIVGRIFGPDSVDDLRTQLKHWGDRGLNVYFSVNQVIPGEFQTKASREGISIVTHLHVDIDPRAGEDVDAERHRIETLSKNLPSNIPPATWVVFSGGGYQLFWELDIPLEVDGDLDVAEDIKLYNLYLESELGGDNCHNVDRIMRLPGTVNVPDKKKLAKGRTRKLACVVSHNPDLIYSIDSMRKAVKIQVDTGFASTSSVHIGGNIQKVADMSELGEWAKENGGTLSDYTKTLIVQGDDPEDPTKYGGDRSKALFAAVRLMLKARLTDTQVYAVITDSDWGISASVVDKGSSMDRYAKRQIERAKEYAVSPELLLLNEQHAVISSVGGKCVVMEEIYNAEIKRSELVYQGMYDFRHRYMNRKVSLGPQGKEGKEKFIPLGQWWLEHPDRRQYSKVVCAPGGAPADAYNLWQGFSVEPAAGECALFLDHVRDNICSGNEEHYDYLINWMARAVQHPERAGGTAVVLRGDQGTGKSLFVKMFGSLFGRHFTQVSDAKHLVGSFNQHLRDCIVLFGDEAFFAGDKKHEGALKTLVTEEHLAVEAKYMNVEMVVNRLHILLASNSSWVVPAGFRERRFFMLDVSPNKIQDLHYFKAIMDQMRNGGQAALLYYLLHRDIDNFQFRQIPDSDALTEQKSISMSPDMEWWLSKLMDGAILEQSSWGTFVGVKDVHRDYTEYMQSLGLFRRSTQSDLMKLLDKAMPGTFPDMVQIYQTRFDGSRWRPRCLVPAGLQQCRDHWDETFYKVDWKTLGVDVEEDMEQEEPTF